MSKRNTREAKARRRAERERDLADGQRCDYSGCGLPWREVVVSVRGWHKKLCAAHSEDVQDILGLPAAHGGKHEVAAVYGEWNLPLADAQRMVTEWMAADGRA